MRRVLLALLAAIAVFALAGAAPAGIPKDPRWKSSNPIVGWNNAGFVLNNNEWNSSAPQTIWADSFHYWGTESTQPKANRVVQSYPCVEKNFNEVPVRSLPLIRSGFAESMPRDKSGLAAEAANDVWLNNHTLEVMIWVDNHTEIPLGRPVSRATLFGQHFRVWHGGATFTFVLNHNETRGVTHILAAIDWLIKHRQIPSNVTLTQISFGWEIASTDGKARDFTVRRYWLSTRPSRARQQLGHSPTPPLRRPEAAT
jgi:Glycosyl hydrolase family 12